MCLLDSHQYRKSLHGGGTTKHVPLITCALVDSQFIHICVCVCVCVCVCMCDQWVFAGDLGSVLGGQPAPVPH